MAAAVNLARRKKNRERLFNLFRFIVYAKRAQKHRELRAAQPLALIQKGGEEFDIRHGPLNDLSASHPPLRALQIG